MNLANTVLGIELGSTRIKAVLIDDKHFPLASGSFEWENHFIDGFWTYPLDEVETGLQSCYKCLCTDFEKRYGLRLTRIGAIGISGMMHGYLPFDSDGNQLTIFKTWRNTCTSEAAELLSARFDFNISQRWSIAHLYQCILNDAPHLQKLSYLCTLAAYVHWKLTGEKLVGVGEASGMFPIDSATGNYDLCMLNSFNELIKEKGYSWTLNDVLPRVVKAGEPGGFLTPDGALFLDPSGALTSGIPVAPCEGDAGTGMVATNSLRVNTGNVSAGTSAFAMLVTDKQLKRHQEIDMVTTPSGLPVAMVHCNNCTSDINAWVGIFLEVLTGYNIPRDQNHLFSFLFNKALEGATDCDGLLSYNYISGEGVTTLDEGRPVFARTPSASFTLSNFMRAHLYSALSTLKIGLDILTQEEDVQIDRLYAHGGFFKTPKVGQLFLSAAVNAPVSVMKTAGEGGPYGMALLAAYLLWHDTNETLEDYLDNKVFNTAEVITIRANEADVSGFRAFIESYKKGLTIEKAAIEAMQ